MNNFDIIGLYDLDTVNIPGYSTFVKNRMGKCRIRSGSALVAVRDNIFNHTTELKCSYENGIWLKYGKEFTQGENNVLLAFLYIPPGGTRHSNEEYFDVIEFSNNDDILISGDFNARTRTLPDFVQFDKDDIHTMHFYNVVQKYLLDVEHLNLLLYSGTGSHRTLVEHQTMGINCSVCVYIYIRIIISISPRERDVAQR